MSLDPAILLQSRWDRVGGHTLHSRVSVAPPLHSAPPIVLVHGLGISSLYMVPTAIHLAPRYRVLAPDLPGFGKSSKPDEVLSISALADALAAWMEVLDLQRVVLVGNSLGCQIIAHFATRYDHHIHAAVLAGPTMDRHGRTAGQQLGRWLVDWTQEPPSLAAAHVRDYVRAGFGRVWKTFRYALHDLVEQKLPALSAPTLVVRGARDPIVPQKWAKEVTASLPAGELRVIPEAPHVVNYTTPLEFTRVIEEFLRSLGAS